MVCINQPTAEKRGNFQDWKIQDAFPESSSTQPILMLYLYVRWDMPMRLKKIAVFINQLMVARHGSRFCLSMKTQVHQTLCWILPIQESCSPVCGSLS